MATAFCREIILHFGDIYQAKRPFLEPMTLMKAMNSDRPKNSQNFQEFQQNFKKNKTLLFFFIKMHVLFNFIS